MPSVLIQRVLDLAHFESSSPLQGGRLPYPSRHTPPAGMDANGVNGPVVQDAIVFKLPTELLSRIFLFAAEIDPPSSARLLTKHRASSLTDLRPAPRARRNTILAEPVPDRLGWIRVTHVCQRWRSAALAYSVLWETIPLALGAKWARAALERAQSSKLVILHTFYPGTGGSTFLAQTNFLPNELHRIRTLELGGAPDTLGDILKRLTAPASSLQTLAIQADRPSGPNEDWPLTLPRALFDGSVPCLRELTLDNCLPSTTQYDLRRLRQLSLCLRPSKRLPGSPLDTFSLLREMAELESVTLKHCLPDTPNPREERFELPSLRRINLVDTQSAIAHLLRLVTFPNTASLDIQCSMPSDGDADESALAYDIISPCLSRVNEPRSVKFFTDGRGLAIEVSSKLKQKRPDLYLFLIHSGLGQWDCPRLVRNTFASIHPARVELIDLRFPTNDAGGNWKSLPDLWTEALSPFRNVRAVRTARTHGWALCSALNDGALFPHLEVLTLVDVDFHAPLFLDNVLTSVVRARRCVLRKVRLIGCEFRETILPELRSMVEVDVLFEEPNEVELDS